MSENLYALERLSERKAVEFAAEVRRDHVGADAARRTRRVQQPAWQPIRLNFLAEFLPFRRPVRHERVADAVDAAITPG